MVQAEPEKIGEDRKTFGKSRRRGAGKSEEKRKKEEDQASIMLAWGKSFRHSRSRKGRGKKTAEPETRIQ